MAISFNSKLKVPDDVLISDLQGESVILNLANERYYGLDDVGTRFLSVLTESDSIESAYQVLLAEYDVEADVLRSDLLTMVEQLFEQGLIEISPE